jgi:hypothetical protein
MHLKDPLALGSFDKSKVISPVPILAKVGMRMVEAKKTLKFCESRYHRVRKIKKIRRIKGFKFEWGTPTLENPEIAQNPGFPGKFSSMQSWNHWASMAPKRSDTRNAQ